MYPYPCDYSQIADDLQCVLDCFNGCPACGACDCERAVWAVTGFVRCQAAGDLPYAESHKKKKKGAVDKKHLKAAVETLVTQSKLKGANAKVTWPTLNIPWEDLFDLLVRSLREGIQILVVANA